MRKFNVRRKAQLGLDIREGGIAIPIASNMYYMNGRSHDNGGIAIGPNNKNGLEVEGGEVVKVGKNDVKVFSSVPFLRGVSPAQLVMVGANPNKVFKAQEEFKDRNRINDDGTTYEIGGQKIININELPSSFRGQLRNGKYVQTGTPPITNKAKSWNNTFKDHINSLNVEMKNFIMDGIKYGKQVLPKPFRKYYARGINILNSPGVEGINNTAQKITQVRSIVDEKKFGGRQKADFGTYQPKRNEKGQVVLDPNNPQDVAWLREQQGKRGAKSVHKGQQEFLEGALNRTTPIILGVAAANPITTAASLAGGYLLGEVGETSGQLYKTLTGKDYTREGKVIGQTLGGLFGPVGAKLFGKGATNAWNTYKSNKLNSTQTLIDVPEEGLVIKEPIAPKTPPKQIEQINTQKYLPTEVEDLTWREPKALLETQAQVTRRDLKNFNRWAKLFGYEPVPLRYAETKSIADRHVQDRIRQHNTFLRGVAKPNAPQRQAIEYELAKEGITNPTDYDVYTYMATHSAPTTGAGRADLRPIQVRKHKVGNFNLSKTSDSPIGALYTQGSGRGAAGYAGLGPISGGHRRTGVVVEVARPTNFRPGASYAEWVKENDFNFGDIKSKGFHEKVANRVVEGTKTSDNYAVSAKDKSEMVKEIKEHMEMYPFKTIDEVYNYADVMKDAMSFENQYKGKFNDIFKVSPEVYDSWDITHKIAYSDYIKNLSLSPSTKQIKPFKYYLDKSKNIFKDRYKDYIKQQTKANRDSWLTKGVDYNPEDYTQPDFSVLKSTSRNRGNAQQHYIFRAPIGEKILEGRGFYLPTEEEIINATTDHYPLWTPGYSRNTRKFGGIKKFKFGGSMIYTINGNVKNGLMNVRPKAEWGKGKDEYKWFHTSKPDIPRGYAQRTPYGEIYENGESYLVINEKNAKRYINNRSFTFMDKAIKHQLNKRPQYYAEKRLPIAGSQSIAEKAGLARSGWSYADSPIFDYVPKINISVPIDYTKAVSDNSKKSTSSTPRGEGSKASKATTKSIEYPSVVRRDEYYSNNEPKGNSTPIDEAYAARQSRGIQAVNEQSTPSTGDETQSKDERLIPQFKPINTGDWFGLGSNLAGHIASYFTNNALLSKYPMPIKPVMAQAAKLKTTHNINPELTNKREVELTNRGVVRRNTQSSNTSIAREQRIMNESRDARNKLYGQKENIETQLINLDRRNRQDIHNRNVAAYNDWLNKTYVAKANKLLEKQKNMMSLINGMPSAVNHMLGVLETRKNTNNTIRAIAAANPNVDGRLLGIGDYYIGEKTKKKYDKFGNLIG